MAVPWLTWGEKPVISSTDELKGVLKKEFDGIQEKEAVLEIEANLSYEQFLAKVGKNIKPEVRKAYDSVLSKDDRVLYFRVNRAPAGLLFIAWRDGQAKLVGLRDTD